MFQAAWEAGCKGITVYRDGSRSSQPKLLWASPEEFPPGTLDYISAAIDNLGQRLHFCEYGWNPAYS